MWPALFSLDMCCSLFYRIALYTTVFVLFKMNTAQLLQLLRVQQIKTNHSLFSML